MIKIKNTYVVVLLIVCALLLSFTACKKLVKWAFVLPGGLAYNEMLVCKDVFEKNYGGVFDRVGPGKSGKPAIILLDGGIIPTYGILHHIASLEKGDSIWKPRKSLDYYVVKLESPDEVITFYALETLPCR